MILIGTSGYSFADWKGPFYPQGLPDSKTLSYYAEEFPTVEINTSFYRLPQRKLFGAMKKRVPPQFLFWIKLYRGLTHEASLDPAQLSQMIDSVAPLEDSGQLAGLLAQFPWSFRNHPAAWDRIERLAEAARPRMLAVEFRHDSWNRPEVFGRLRDRAMTYCIVDAPPISNLMPSVVHTTSTVAYFRFHGRNSKAWWSGSGSERYNYSYSPEELNHWKDRIQQVESKVRKVFVFFNNCHAGHAAKNAQMLRELLGQPLPSGRLF